MANKLKIGYAETSALTGDGVEDLFNKLIKSIMS
jgi:hypothetical protein